MASGAPAILGYVSCSRCGEPWVLKVVAARTGGLCPDKCWIETRGNPDLPVSSNGRTYHVKRTGTARNRPKKLTPRRRERIKTRDKARQAAYRRLAELHNAEFTEILAEERARLGLDPWTVDAALRIHAQEASTS